MLNDGKIGLGSITAPVSLFEAPGSTTNSSGKFGSFELQSYAVNNAWLAENAYYNGGFKLRANGAGTLLYLVNGLQVRTIKSGTAGQTASQVGSLSNGDGRLTVDGVGNFAVGGTFDTSNWVSPGYPALTILGSTGRVGLSVGGRWLSLTERLEVAGNIAANNATTATAVLAYNTFTDSSNYERSVSGWTTSSNVLTIGAQAAGTGVVRPVSFVGASFSFNADAIRITTNRTPSAATDACAAGELFSDDNYIYKCVASGNIKRTAIATW